MCKSTWADEDPPVPEILLWSDRKTIIVRYAIKKKEKDLKKKKTNATWYIVEKHSSKKLHRLKQYW